MRFSVGIDVGGTFTDLVAVRDGELIAAKVRSVPQDQSLVSYCKHTIVKEITEWQKKGAGEKTAVLLVTSDRGLCGAGRLRSQPRVGLHLHDCFKLRDRGSKLVSRCQSVSQIEVSLDQIEIQSHSLAQLDYRLID